MPGYPNLVYVPEPLPENENDYQYYTDHGTNNVQPVHRASRKVVVEAARFTRSWHFEVCKFWKDPARCVRLQGRLFKLEFDKFGFSLRDVESSELVPMGLNLTDSSFEPVFVNTTGTLMLSQADLANAVGSMDRKSGCPVYEVVQMGYGPAMGDYVSEPVRCIRLNVESSCPELLDLHFLDRAQLRLSLQDMLMHGDWARGYAALLNGSKPEVVNLDLKINVLCCFFAAHGNVCEHKSLIVNKFASTLAGRCVTKHVFIIALSPVETGLMSAGLMPTHVNDVVFEKLVSLWRSFRANLKI